MHYSHVLKIDPSHLDARELLDSCQCLMVIYYWVISESPSLVHDSCHMTCNKELEAWHYLIFFWPVTRLQSCWGVSESPYWILDPRHVKSNEVIEACHYLILICCWGVSVSLCWVIDPNHVRCNEVIKVYQYLIVLNCWAVSESPCWVIDLIMWIGLHMIRVMWSPFHMISVKSVSI